MSRVAVEKMPKAGVSRVKRNSKFSAFLTNPKALTGVIIFAIFTLTAILAPVIAPYSPAATTFLPMLQPSAAHWFGTTNTGQDIFSQFIWGTRTSMEVGIEAALISTLIAFLIGGYAGLMGGWLDGILNSFSNILLVLPTLALLLVIESFVHNPTPQFNGLTIAFTSWAWGARVFRSLALSLAQRDFIVAARLSGAGSIRILFSEILPNMTSVLASNLIYSFLGAVLFEAGLAVLGFENVSTYSLGTILYWAQNGGAMMEGAWWWFVPPGLAIAVLGTSLILMNFAIDQITNPRLREQRGRRKANKRTGRDSGVNQQPSA